MHVKFHDTVPWQDSVLSVLSTVNFNQCVQHSDYNSARWQRGCQRLKSMCCWLLSLPVQRYMPTCGMQIPSCVVHMSTWCCRFGVPGLRIFNLLLTRGQLEQKQVADFGMLPVKDTRELLYQMMRDGFLSLQDIPRSADRAPSRSFYTWRVDLQAVYERIAGKHYSNPCYSRQWLGGCVGSDHSMCDVFQGQNVYDQPADWTALL